jgi:hypothetical protein
MRVRAWSAILACSPPTSFQPPTAPAIDLPCDNSLAALPTYYVDNTGDEVLEDEAGGLDLVRSSVNYALSAHVERLTLTGAAATEGVGNDDVNLITGNDAANVPSG